MGRATTRLGFIERLPLAVDRPLLGYGAAVALSMSGLIARELLAPVLPGSYPSITFLPAVTVAVFLFGAGPGIVAALLSGVLVWALYVGPAAGASVTFSALLSMLLYVFITGVNIVMVHLMQRANRRLAQERTRCQQLADTRAVLFRELQHRISNNLQVVSSLIGLQKRRIADEDARNALDEAARRLVVIGRIHRNLHDPEGGALSPATFLRQLVVDTLDANGRQDISHDVRVAPAASLRADAAIPVALIVAETIANALEHGFGNTAQGHIDVEMRRHDDGTVHLEVRDNGKGLPVDFDVMQGDSLGLRIVTMLTRQLGGGFSLFRDAGATVARLTIPPR
ncbi:sensor histidine kinase [Sphingomonas quercus]|uniref:histidine kinase n=1 Tax=Sphingomonas quercus TaxID=2842451 RepID=A0ABS6BLW1_9SPHN|nr:histidine kinase dimerization/phosphoacceptor domain -containing protein [Sphingomonas quercus]MBU3079293.1 DUF4118 domain-containing protein [Sphingomonas quercus]